LRRCRACRSTWSRLALRRYEFNVKPITPAVAAGQQQIADTFFALKLIPKPIKVGDAVVAAQP
jgi:sulfonate transport system substrate-binding protein